MTDLVLPLVSAVLAAVAPTPSAPLSALAPTAPLPGAAPAAVARRGAAVLPAPVYDATLEPVRRSGPVRFEARPAPFRLTVDGAVVPHEVLAVTVLPGETVRLAVGGVGLSGYEMRFAAGEAATEGAGLWSWRAPRAPGVVPVSVVSPAGASVRLNVLVAHPAASVRDGLLGDYRIGSYRATPLRGDPAYLPPRGFIEVSPDDEDLLVSPHFTLGEFLCKQPGLPRYLALSTPLVLKLEAVLEAANARGLDVPGLTVMSGFRTPWYNRAIGNTTDYSRHLWGDAADVYVDADGDGDMDDLDGNGRVDLADARVLAAVVDDVERSGDSHVVPGGMGLYRRNAVHGPFVHVDARGTPARW